MCSLILTISASHARFRRVPRAVEVSSSVQLKTKGQIISSIYCMVARSKRHTSSLGSIHRLCFADQVVKPDEDTVPHINLGFIQSKVNWLRELRLERPLSIASLAAVRNIDTRNEQLASTPLIILVVSSFLNTSATLFISTSSCASSSSKLHSSASLSVASLAPRSKDSTPTSCAWWTTSAKS